MSDQSWKEEFYPTDASTFKDSNDLVGATKHSLQKWRGHLKGALKKHDLDEVPDDFFRGSGFECALCSACFKINGFSEFEKCATCPIFLCGYPPCSVTGSAWKEWKSGRNPEGMVSQLERVLEHIEALERGKQP